MQSLKRREGYGDVGDRLTGMSTELVYTAVAVALLGGILIGFFIGFAVCAAMIRRL